MGSCGRACLAAAGVTLGWVCGEGEQVGKGSLQGEGEAFGVRVLGRREPVVHGRAGGQWGGDRPKVSSQWPIGHLWVTASACVQATTATHVGPQAPPSHICVLPS